MAKLSPTLLNVVQVADRAGVSASTVLADVRAGRLAHVRDANGRIRIAACAAANYRLTPYRDELLLNLEELAALLKYSVRTLRRKMKRDPEIFPIVRGSSRQLRIRAEVRDRRAP